MSTSYWKGLESVETASDTLYEILSTAPEDLFHISVLGRSPLRFAIDVYDEELGMALLPYWNLDSSGDDGVSILHAAIQGDLSSLVFAFIQDFPFLLERTTLDCPWPFGKGVESGGRTVLHAAAELGNLEYVKALVERIDIHVCDWDGATPIMIAQLHNRDSIIEFLETKGGLRSSLVSTLQEKAQERYARSVCNPVGKWKTLCTFKQLLTVDECCTITTALQERNWGIARHVAFTTTDIPAYQVPEIYTWLQKLLKERLWPKVMASYDVTANDVEFRDLFYVKYECCLHDNDEILSLQKELRLHRDGSMLSFNVLLNSADDFQGGGTFFQEQDTVRCFYFVKKKRHLKFERSSRLFNCRGGMY